MLHVHFFKWEKKIYRTVRSDDFPSFSHRGFMLDTGRKFIPYDTLVDIMLNMAYYKMNDLQLHLNDNYIFLKRALGR